jgi:hypothetical protein
MAGTKLANKSLIQFTAIILFHSCLGKIYYVQSVVQLLLPISGTMGLQLRQTDDPGQISHLLCHTIIYNCNILCTYRPTFDCECQNDAGRDAGHSCQAGREAIQPKNGKIFAFAVIPTT